MEFKTDLLDYQQSAVDKLIGLKVGALYMEQGTGKTRTALSLISARIERKKVNHVLWLCPCSVKRNLYTDIVKHVGYMPDWITIYGIESISASDRVYLEVYDIVKKNDCFLIVDESNLVKNKEALRTQRIIRLAESCKYKLILNGTPVSKNEADMFAQWYILDWRILGYQSYWSFAANHVEYWTILLPNGNEIEDRNRIKRILDVDYLTAKIAPYSYQIKKSDCLSDLPAKQYHHIAFDMSEAQAVEYAITKERYLDRVKEWKAETIYRLFTALQHVTAGRKIISDIDDHMETKPMFPWTENNRITTLLDAINNYIKGDKCIIFAKYKNEIADIKAALTNKYGSESVVEFTGNINQKTRQENIEKFRGDAQFFIANKACGAYGLNLQFCHNIIYYDNDFDFATRAQSEDRIHRIGQTEEVQIYDIYVRSTIDEFIIDCLDGKEKLVDKFKREIDKWKEHKNERKTVHKRKCI